MDSDLRRATSAVRQAIHTGTLGEIRREAIRLGVELIEARKMVTALEAKLQEQAASLIRAREAQANAVALKDLYKRERDALKAKYEGD